MAQYDDLAFTSQHEWVRVDPPQGGGGMTATVGITAYAADKLGDVVFVDLPDAGETITTGAVVGEIESTKSVGEIFAPVDGVVIEKNSAVIEAPELVNSDPFGAGWLIRVDFTRLPTLLSHQEYQVLIDEQDSTH